MNDPLAIYLHDHLSAAAFAVELLQSWQSEQHPQEFRTWAGGFEAEIVRDRETLSAIINELGLSPTSLKQAAGWLAEKATRFKLSHGTSSALARFEGLEVLAVGVVGKLALWDTLRTVPTLRARLQHHDLASLAAIARDQHAVVEARRVEAAQAAFAQSPSGA